MCSHPVGLDVWFLVRPFVYFHISGVRTAKALARLRMLAWAFADHLCDKYHHNLSSWLIWANEQARTKLLTILLACEAPVWSGVLCFFYKMYMWQKYLHLNHFSFLNLLHLYSNVFSKLLIKLSLWIFIVINEPRHDKPTKWLCAQWRLRSAWASP